MNVTLELHLRADVAQRRRQARARRRDGSGGFVFVFVQTRSSGCPVSRSPISSGALLLVRGDGRGVRASRLGEHASGLVQKPERLERGDVVRSQLEREREARVRLLELPGGEVDCARGAHRLHVLGRQAERLVHQRLPVREPTARAAANERGGRLEQTRDFARDVLGRFEIAGRRVGDGTGRRRAERFRGIPRETRDPDPAHAHAHAFAPVRRRGGNRDRDPERGVREGRRGSLEGLERGKLGPQHGARRLGILRRRRRHRREVLLRVAARGDDEPEADGRAVVRQRLFRAPPRVRGAERGGHARRGRRGGRRRARIQTARERRLIVRGRRGAMVVASRIGAARVPGPARRSSRDLDAVGGGRAVPPVEARQAGRGRGREDLVLRSAPAHRSDSRRPDMLFRLLRALGRPRGSRGRNAERHAVRLS
mmetsp:Transcript_14633/g.61751  ORF Transcript_14633/g.61751 Transcript_14633/m.61751 type:complete len:426 (-) Transcript_14633:75-1352(-)